ncbi:MAG: hypothetical protein QW764_04945 [Desulfurococcaceae archaeon]
MSEEQQQTQAQKEVGELAKEMLQSVKELEKAFESAKDIEDLEDVIESVAELRERWEKIVKCMQGYCSVYVFENDRYGEAKFTLIREIELTLTKDATLFEVFQAIREKIDRAMPTLIYETAKEIERLLASLQEALERLEEDCEEDEDC